MATITLIFLLFIWILKDIFKGIFKIKPNNNKRKKEKRFNLETEEEKQIKTLEFLEGAEEDEE